MSDKTEDPKPTFEERPHHPLGPSGLQMVEACPCFQNRKQTVVHERCTAGSRAHDVVEKGEDDQRLSDEDAAAAAECMDFVDRRRQLLEEARTRDVKKLAKESKTTLEEASLATFDIQELAELNVRVDDEEYKLPAYDAEAREWVTIDLDCTTSGYFDGCLIDHTGTHAELFDWKFGMWPVEKAENNVQGISYALGLFKERPELKEVHIFFKQPHLDYVTDALITREMIPHLYLRVLTIVKRAIEARTKASKGDWSDAKAHDPICTFCAHVGRCPKVTEFACNVAHKFYPLEIPENVTPTAVQDPANSSLALRLANVVTVWAKAFKAQVTDSVIRGASPLPDGYSIQNRTGNREITDTKRFREEALLHVTEEELAAATRFAIGEVESLIKEKAPRGMKGKAVAAFKEKLNDEGITKPGDPYSFLRASASKD